MVYPWQLKGEGYEPRLHLKIGPNGVESSDPGVLIGLSRTGQLLA